jgi:prevent-host-death family protein
MERTVGAYEAKTHLAELLDEVAMGSTITITRRGVPVALLTPPTPNRQKTIDEVIEGFREIRRQAKPLGDITIRELIEEGRRF